MKSTKAKQTAETADAGAQSAHVASDKATAAKVTTQKKGAAKGKKAANSGKKGKPAKAKKAAKPAATKKASTPRAEGKGTAILVLVGRPKGATLTELMEATAWQAHSVRGFLSNAGKKSGMKIASAKNEAGDRVYRIG